MSHLILHTDGGARGNPGPAAIGVVIEIESEGKTELLAQVGETIGIASNNVAEYRAIIRGLEEAQRLGAHTVTCLLDSLLVVEQLNGNYRVKSPDMKPLHARVQELRQRFALVTFQHVSREQNEEADRLLNEALDGKPSAGLGVDAGEALFEPRGGG
jgi:ribonuclease HI